jgi:hypothetical protein
MSQGTVRHSKKGKVSVSRESGNVTWSRAGLAQFLIDEVGEGGGTCACCTCYVCGIRISEQQRR